MSDDAMDVIDGMIIDRLTPMDDVEKRRLDALFQDLRENYRPQSWSEVDPVTGRSLTRDEVEAMHAATLARLKRGSDEQEE